MSRNHSCSAGRRWRRVIVCALALCAAQSWAADAVDPRVEAKVLKDQGAQALRDGDARAALERFEAAYSIYPSPNSKYNVALALAKLDRRLEAIEAFESFLATAVDSPASAVEYARGEVARMDRALGHVLVVAQPGAEVTFDNHPLGKTPLRSALRVLPGGHSLAISKAGFEPYRTHLDLGPGMVWASEIALSIRSREARVPRMVTIVVGVVALAATAIGAGLRINAQLAFNRLRDTCAPDCSRAQWAGLPEQVLAGDSLVGIGGAAAVVDIGLWIAARRRRP